MGQAHTDTAQTLAELFATHHNAVARYARRRTQPELVDDAVAETFLVACRRLDAIPAEPLPWLLGVTRRVLATQRRSSQRRLALASKLAANTSEVIVTRENELTFVTAALQKLSEADREAITLIAWEGLTPAQAAVVLGTSRVAFRARLSRARKRLQRYLETAQRAQAYSNELTVLPVRKEEATS